MGNYDVPYHESAWILKLGGIQPRNGNFTKDTKDHEGSSNRVTFVGLRVLCDLPERFSSKYNRAVSSMTPVRIAGALAVVAVFCVLAIFFLPGHEGPYPAVHGPVTALLSIRAATRLRVVIRTGIKAVQNWLGRVSLGIVSPLWTPALCQESGYNYPSSGCPSVLRC